MPFPPPIRPPVSAPDLAGAGSFDQTLALLPDSTATLAVLAGAGISLDSPSNLLAGGDFMDAILGRIMPDEVKAGVVRSLIGVPKGRFFRPGEYIRFETLMTELAQSGIDPDLRVLDCLDACEYPNSNHYVLADLIRRGVVVMTTNFDRLIEIAYRRTMKPGEAPLQVIHDDDRFSPDGPAPANGPTLWKLHGSISVDGQSTRASLQATLVQVMWPSMSRNKAMFLEAVLATRDLIVVGYSGSDDLDLVPVLAEAPAARVMLWVDHVSGDAPAKCETAADIVSSHKALTEYDVVGRDRVFFARALSADPPGETVLISMRTSQLVSCLQHRYCPDLAIPATSAEYEFGRKYPNEVRLFFDGWFANCQARPSSRLRAAMHLLSNRGFRPDIARLRDRLNRRYREAISRPTCTPEEKLDCLMEEFNTRPHPETPTYASLAADRALFDALQDLMPRLPPRLRGTGHRLSACALWNQERRPEGEQMFRLAWGIDREMRQLNQELATLTTWQKATNSLRDHLSDSDHRQFNEIARMMGDPVFPDDAFHRLQELAEQTGYKFRVWEHLLESFDVGFVEEDHERKQLVNREARRMLRAAVDMGDVRGEAKAWLLLALSLYDYGEFEEATEHITCLLELGRTLDLGEAWLRALALLGTMGSEDRQKQLRPRFARSMWV